MVDKERILNALDDFRDDYGTSFSSCYMEETSIIEEALDMYYEKLKKRIMPDKNKVIIEAELSDSQIEALNDKNIDISEPFSTNVTLDYGNEVIYCVGKVHFL